MSPTCIGELSALSLSTSETKRFDFDFVTASRIPIRPSVFTTTVNDDVVVLDEQGEGHSGAAAGVDEPAQQTTPFSAIDTVSGQVEGARSLTPKGRCGGLATL